MHTLIIIFSFIIFGADGSKGLIDLLPDLQKKIFYNADPGFAFILNCSHESYLGSATDLRKLLKINLPPLALTSKYFYYMHNTFDTHRNDIIKIIEYFKENDAILCIDQERKQIIAVNLFNTFCGNEYLKFYPPLSQDLNDPHLETMYMHDDTQKLILTKLKNPFYTNIQEPFDQLFFYSI